MILKKMLRIQNTNARHQKISDECNADYYFCHPYSSWERGLNENTNGLIRQYVPKKSTFFSLSKRRINRIECYINDRSRKTLGYKTLKEVFFDNEIAFET